MLHFLYGKLSNPKKYIHGGHVKNNTMILSLLFIGILQSTSSIMAMNDNNNSALDNKGITIIIRDDNGNTITKNNVENENFDTAGRIKSGMRRFIGLAQPQKSISDDKVQKILIKYAHNIISLELPEELNEINLINTMAAITSNNPQISWPLLETITVRSDNTTTNLAINVDSFVSYTPTRNGTWSKFKFTVTRTMLDKLPRYMHFICTTNNVPANGLDKYTSKRNLIESAFKDSGLSRDFIKRIQFQ